MSEDVNVAAMLKARAYVLREEDERALHVAAEQELQRQREALETMDLTTRPFLDKFFGLSADWEILRKVYPGGSFGTEEFLRYRHDGVVVDVGIRGTVIWNNTPYDNLDALARAFEAQTAPVEPEPLVMAPKRKYESLGSDVYPPIPGEPGYPFPW